MMMRRSFFAVAAVLVAACNSHDAGNNQTATGGGAPGGDAGATSSLPGAGASQMQPGRYEVTSQTNVSGTDLPPGMQERMAQPTTISVCLTPEKAANPMQVLAAHMQEQGCSSNNLSMANGQVTGAINCPGRQMILSGTFTGTSYDLTNRAHSDRNGRVMDMTIHTTSRRVGECNGTEDSAGADEDGGSSAAGAPASNSGK